MEGCVEHTIFPSELGLGRRGFGNRTSISTFHICLRVCIRLLYEGYSGLVLTDWPVPSASTRHLALRAHRCVRFDDWLE